MNSKDPTWDTLVRSRVALVSSRFERLLNRNAKLQSKEDKEGVEALCINVRP